MQLLPVLTVAPVAAANHNNNNSFGNTGPTHRVLSSAGEPQVTVQPVVNGGSAMRMINVSSQSSSHNSNDITVYPWHSLVPFLTTATSMAGGGSNKESPEDKKSPPPPPGNKNDSFGGSKRTGLDFLINRIWKR